MAAAPLRIGVDVFDVAGRPGSIWTAAPGGEYSHTCRACLELVVRGVPDRSEEDGFCAAPPRARGVYLDADDARFYLRGALQIVGDAADVRALDAAVDTLLAER